MSLTRIGIVLTAIFSLALLAIVAVSNQSGSIGAANELAQADVSPDGATADVASRRRAHSHPHPHHDSTHTHGPAGEHSHSDDRSVRHATEVGHQHGDGQFHTHLPVNYDLPAATDDYAPPAADAEGYYYWKGNLHTHTLWSDGDGFPEVVTDWYKRHGYHFLALSDHNVLSRGQGVGIQEADTVSIDGRRWLNPATSGFARSGRGMRTYEIYRERFGDEWVETRQDEAGNLLVRLKPLQEFRPLFEEPGRFLMIESEEITDHRAVHVNATNIAQFIAPQRGDTVRQTIENNVNAVLEQRSRTGQPMFPHLNHPNFSSAVTVEEMVDIERLQFFEVYNGHRGVRNYGHRHIKHLDRVWDIMLARRLGELGLGILYGVAVDDAHHYDDTTTEVARPGRGWVMVRSRFLTPERLIAAMERGDFYASNGVTLRRVQSDGRQLHVEVEAEPEVTYTIEFIGTRRDFDTASEPILDPQGKEIRATRRYSDEIGVVLQRNEADQATYQFQGDELYVRAKVTSSKLKDNPFEAGEMEMAWIQPVVPATNEDKPASSGE